MQMRRESESENRSCLNRFLQFKSAAVQGGNYIILQRFIKNRKLLQIKSMKYCELGVSKVSFATRLENLFYCAGAYI